MKKLKLVAYAAAIALLFNSCGKDGATGPAGPAGANGVANISSTIYTVTPGSWSSVTGGYTYTTTDAAITSASTDGVEVFISFNDIAWTGLPLNNSLYNGDETAYAYQNGQMEFEYVYTSAPTQTFYFKVVVIPPAVMKQHPNTNWHDYNQVQAIMDTQKASSN